MVQDELLEREGLLIMMVFMKYSEINLHKLDSPEIAIEDNSSRTNCDVISREMTGHLKSTLLDFPNVKK